MSQVDRADESRFLKCATQLLLGVVILENGFALLVVAAMAPVLCFLIIAALAGLTYFLFGWLRLNNLNATLALIGTALAAAAWPWTTLLLLGWLLPIEHGVDLAWLFGPLVPYPLIAAVGLGKRCLARTT
jgi:hypothetical protein